MTSHHREHYDHLTGLVENEAFRECSFDTLNGLSLKGCDLTKSRFIAQKLDKVLDFTITLNCLSFNEVELSPLIFDLILCLLLKTKGNDAKRRKILSDVLGKKRAFELLKQMETME